MKTEPSLEDTRPVYEGPVDGDEIIAYTSINRHPTTLEVVESGVTVKLDGSLDTLICVDCDGDEYEIRPVDILHWMPA